MNLRDSTHLLRKLNPYCAKALEAAVSLCQARLHGQITLEHWLLKLLESGDGDIPAILRHYQFDIDAIWKALLARVDRLPHNLRGKPALAPSLMEVLQGAWFATGAGLDEDTIRSARLLQALVESPNCLHATDAWPLLSITAGQIQRLGPVLDRFSTESSDGDVPAAPATIGDDKRSPVADPPSQSRQFDAQASRASPRQAPEDADAVLMRFAIDLTARAERGEIDPVYGRDNEIQQLVDVLIRRRKNNPILVGEPGVGKTALVEGLAVRVIEGTVPTALRNVRILTLDLGLLQAGAGVKGEFEQRLKSVIDEVKSSAVPILLFIDEAHTLIGAGNAAGGSDAANLLKPALARGELRTIAATTWSEYKEYFERDAALERRFQLVKVNEPDDAASCLMLRGLVDRYAQHHGVHIQDDAVVAAVKLSRRYIPERQLPDKAVDLIDTAAARVRIGLDSPPIELQRAGAAVVALQLELDALIRDKEVGTIVPQGRYDAVAKSLDEARNAAALLEERYQCELRLVTALRDHREGMQTGEVVDDATKAALFAAKDAVKMAQDKTPLVFIDVDADAIARVVAEWTGVPVGSLLEDEVKGLLSLEGNLGERVVAQEPALAALTESLRTAKAGLTNEDAPIGVFLLVGPSGVGKTETAIALADLLFGGKGALTTINMSEYQEAHTVSQLKGSPPGYVGYGRGGPADRGRPQAALQCHLARRDRKSAL